MEVFNRVARHEYEVLDEYEAGIVLVGTEIKSIRKGSANIKDSYCRVKDGEMFIINMHISKYEEGNRYNHEETRERKLLLEKKDILKIKKKVELDHLTIVPLKLYINHGFAKIKIGVCRGKKLHDKRADMKKRDMEREVKKSFKINNR